MHAGYISLARYSLGIGPCARGRNRCCWPHIHTSSILLVRLLAASENHFIPRQHKVMQVTRVIRSVYTKFWSFQSTKEFWILCTVYITSDLRNHVSRDVMLISGRIVLISENKLVPSSERPAWLLRWRLCDSLKHQEWLAQSCSVAYQNTWVLCSTAFSSQGLADQWSVCLWRNPWLWKVNNKNTHWANFAVRLYVLMFMNLCIVIQLWK